MIGDGKLPDLFFVTLDGVVIVISRDFEFAHTKWRQLANERKITCLESRKVGVVSSRDWQENEEGKQAIETHDDSWMWYTKDGKPKRLKSRKPRPQ